MAGLNARQLAVEDFEPDELPGDPTDAASLAEGGNFRTETDDGILDIMQSVSGNDRELGYDQLAGDAIHAAVFGIPVAVCSLSALLEMKRAAGRPQDLEDLKALKALAS